MRKIETKNMMIIELMDSYKKQIFEASVIYHKFEENLKKIGESQGQNGENEKIYMITKEFLDNFKNKINYNKTKDLFVDRDNEENFKKFEDNMAGCQVDDLEYIIFGEFRVSCIVSILRRLRRDNPTFPHKKSKIPVDIFKIL